jgi:ribosomal protein S12 methylthiotransferase accessory factor
MGADNIAVHYTLRLVKTESGTGYFSCFPGEDLDFDTHLRYARAHPNDEFMRKHLLRLINGWGRDALQQAIQAGVSSDLFLLALFFEACLLNRDFNPLQRLFDPALVERLANFTPLVFIGSTLLVDRAVHAAWIQLFRSNIAEHRELPAPEEAYLTSPFPDRLISKAGKVKGTLQEVFDRTPVGLNRLNSSSPDAVETAATALERLARAGIDIGPEMRHESSLSPIALLRQWVMKTTVHNERHHFRFEGEQTAYGRGLDLESARAACAMEIVERCSAFASFVPGRVIGYRKAHVLMYGRASDLQRENLAHLDPNRMTLELPYSDAPLYWIAGEEPDGNRSRSVFIPVQCVFLFCNLDENKLFSALGSTGLAAGSTMEAAKVSALLEVIERDSESVMPFSPERCFEIETEDPSLATLLNSYSRLGIQIQFQDITTPLGVPCCKCFVVSGEGRVVKGTGAHLNARRAMLAAMTETPYPYPGGPPSQPAMKGLLRVPFEKLPDYSSGNDVKDLKLIETLLESNGFRPIYVDLTRKDLGIPVVRAIVPGMELLGDFDHFSRVNPRLYANYISMFRSQD